LTDTDVERESLLAGVLQEKKKCKKTQGKTTSVGGKLSSTHAFWPHRWDNGEHANASAMHPRTLVDQNFFMPSLR
jgi:hypothetical protein